jgi:predicted dinucleotide-binding enzyme
MRIAIIGAGFSGRALARLAVQRGHDVMLSNSRDPATLGSVMIRCKVGTAEDAASFGDVVVLMVPFANHADLPAERLAEKIVIDAINYDPARDIKLAVTPTEVVAAHFAGAFVVKAFNVIGEKELEKDAAPSGLHGRRALPVAGDDGHAKETVIGLLDQLGFDAVDAGPLAQGWRFDLGRPAHGVRLDSAALTQAV